jgi:poly-gamma-glutamate synthesis protein (capsule biosynthesis protein)
MSEVGPLSKHSRREALGLFALAAVSGCGEFASIAGPRSPQAAAPNADPVVVAALGSGARSCDESVSWIGAGGDVVMHRELQRAALTDPRGFGAAWHEVADMMSWPDLTVLNVEGTMAPGIDWRGRAWPTREPDGFEGRIYTGYPRFNVHPSLARDLARDGVDLVSTANNHAWDRGPEGVAKTLASLETAGLAAVGTRPERLRKDTPWSVVTQVGAFRVGWVACTRQINGVADAGGTVLRCGERGRWVRNDVRRLRARDDVDAIGVLPHWGVEYDPTPGPEARAQARAWIEAGADFVLGSHPHVLQPWEHIEAADGRHALVVYSMGNFVSHQRELPRRSSAFVWLALQPDGPRAALAGFGYVPLVVKARDGSFSVEPVVAGESPGTWAHVTEAWGAAFALPPVRPELADCGARWWESPSLRARDDAEFK